VLWFVSESTPKPFKPNPKQAQNEPHRPETVIWGILWNSRHPDPHRVWNGGPSSTSWHHFGGTGGTAGPVESGCEFQKADFWIQFREFDTRYLIWISLLGFSPLPSIIIGFDVKLQPLSSISRRTSPGQDRIAWPEHNPPANVYWKVPCLVVPWGSIRPPPQTPPISRPEGLRD